ncbi:MAG: hypothetical protein J6O04_09655 [Selenomonadaceae bacterium]|nr:hypothetical protein [Selenomonadaceae bacterium]
MTNKEKFIEVMNKYFDARLTEENFQRTGDCDCECTPCGVYRKYACDMSDCHACAIWWDEEWEPKGDKQ